MAVLGGHKDLLTTQRALHEVAAKYCAHLRSDVLDWCNGPRFLSWGRNMEILHHLRNPAMMIPL